MSLAQWIDLPCVQDERGSLVAVEGLSSIPFAIQRVYYLFGMQQGASRGSHAHRALQQVIVPVAGRCRMVLDDGRQRESVCMGSPTKGLLVGPMVWREVHDVSADCVLLVLASAHYDSADYIRTYEEFLTCLSSN